jgi:RHS repeat-associated protein
MPTPQQFITRPVAELFGRQPNYGFAGFGVSTAIGNFTHTVVDLGFPSGTLGLLDLARTYNSLSTTAATTGPGWSTTFGASLTPPAQGGILHHAAGPVTFTDTDGRVLAFTPNPAGGYNRPQDLDADLTHNADGSYTLAYNSGETWSFDASGRATGRVREGQSVAFDYDAGGQLLRATHSSGPQLILSYDSAGRLTQAESGDGRTVGYGYAADGSLAAVTSPVGGVTRYATLADGSFQLTDPDGNVVVTNHYDSDGLVSSQDLATGGSAAFGYSATGQTTVTSQSGAVMTFQADTSGRLSRVTDPNGNAASFAYDANGYLSQGTSPGGVTLTQAHDARGNLQTSVFGGATTGYAYDASDRPVSITDPVGGVIGYGYGTDSYVPTELTDQNGAVSQFEAANGLVTRLTDADGNVTTYDYDAAGNLISFTDPAGEVTRYGYDTAGRRTSQITPTGATTQWSYDAAGRVSSATDPDGAVTSYQYSAAGRLLQITDPTGAVTRHGYDAAGQLIAATDPLGRVTRYAYDHDGNLTTTTAPTGAVTSTDYDQAGRVTSVTDPAGAVTRHEYDADGNLTAVTDPLGHVTRRAYDQRGNLISVTDPTGAVTRYEYDATDRKTAAIAADGGIWRTVYDPTGNAIARVNPLGAVIRQAWTPAGHLAARTDPLGRQTQFSYSPTGQVIAVTDPEQGITRYAYDADGRQTSITTPAGLVTRNRWDPAGRLVASVDPRGWITRYEYDPRGLQIAEILPSGATTRDRYDPAGQHTEVIDPNGSPTTFGYDEAGHLTEITDAKSGITRYAYDAAGRQTAQTDPLGRTTTRAYDGAGNLVTITDPSGHSQHMTYDASRRLTGITADDGSAVSYAYDGNGRRISMTDASGTTHYGYDLAGQLLTVTEPDGAVTATAYDATGQRTSLTYPDGLELAYTYDGNGYLTGLHDSRAGDAVYAVDADGRLLTEQLPGMLARRYHYDRGLLSRFLVIRDGHPIARTHFTYDPDGRIATQRDGRERSTYRYDPAGQLTAVIREDIAHRDAERPRAPRPPRERGPEPAELHLTYDVLGNRTHLRDGHAEIRYSYDAASQLLRTEAGGRRTDYRYDSSGRLIEEHEGERRRETSYNGLGIPVAVTTTSPGQHQHGQAVFNGDWLLSSLTITRENGHRGEERAASVRYLWSTDQVPQILSQRTEPHLEDAERDRAGRLDADFAYGYGRTFASWEHGAAAFHSDAFGSAIRTEETEPWVQSRRYEVFGAPDDDRDGEPRPPHDPELPRFGYRGELALGHMVYLRARTYDTRLGRFTTPDLLGSQASASAAVSPYAYVANDPLNGTDPLGLFSFGSIFSHVEHAIDHVVRGVRHIVHGITGTITRGADVVAGAAAHAFDLVHTVLDQVAATAWRDAGHVFDLVRTVAEDNIHAVSDAVSRSVGFIRTAATAGIRWIKKHNQIIGKIGSFLNNVTGYLALAGLVIAPIPGLDFLTPVLEGAAVATSLAALATQGVARAAGDENITYGDLFSDAIGAIPGGGDVEDGLDGLNTANRIAEESEETATQYARRVGAEGEDLSGIAQDEKVRIPSASGKAQYRIPDDLTDTDLTEIKNVKRLDNRSQLQDFYAYASSTNRRFNITVREDTVLSPTLEQMVDDGKINLLRTLPKI